MRKYRLQDSRQDGISPCTDRGHGEQVFKDMVNTF
ncbi:Uncharacterised protein [Serratia fonticola]|uniref:Uncharacterized protein n=1 Tax=Serratia fonticola TaxID=47917 RepID=A0A448S632_SERFO|nr:Uncharacterised protein [Serratia fonticola]